MSKTHHLSFHTNGYEISKLEKENNCLQFKHTTKKRNILRPQRNTPLKILKQNQDSNCQVSRIKRATSQGQKMMRTSPSDPNLKQMVFSPYYSQNYNESEGIKANKNEQVYRHQRNYSHHTFQAFPSKLAHKRLFEDIKITKDKIEKLKKLSEHSYRSDLSNDEKSHQNDNEEKANKKLLNSLNEDYWDKMDPIIEMKKDSLNQISQQCEQKRERNSYSYYDSLLSSNQQDGEKKLNDFDIFPTICSALPKKLVFHQRKISQNIIANREQQNYSKTQRSSNNYQQVRNNHKFHLRTFSKHQLSSTDGDWSAKVKNKLGNFHKKNKYSHLDLTAMPNKSGGHDKFLIKNFELGLRKSQDLYGVTYPARHIKTGLIMCIKIVNKRDILQQNALENFIKAYKIQNFIKSQKTIQIYGIFEENENIYILMQYFQEGSLFIKIKSRKKNDSEQCLQYMKDITEGLVSLHDHNIVTNNGNIRSENISFFLDVCKICNFPVLCSDEKIEHAQKIDHCAPETLFGSKVSKYSDIWSLGILLYEMLVGSTPTQNRSKKRTLKQIQSLEISYPDEIRLDIKELLQRILQKDPKKRPSMNEIRQQIEILQPSDDLRVSGWF